MKEKLYAIQIFNQNRRYIMTAEMSIDIPYSAALNETPKETTKNPQQPSVQYKGRSYQPIKISNDEEDQYGAWACCACCYWCAATITLVYGAYLWSDCASPNKTDCSTRLLTGQLLTISGFLALCCGCGICKERPNAEPSPEGKLIKDFPPSESIYTRRY